MPSDEHFLYRGKQVMVLITRWKEESNKMNRTATNKSRVYY
jgi:hypothetical protein